MRSRRGREILKENVNFTLIYIPDDREYKTREQQRKRKRKGVEE